jgi:1,4-dihydroxy-2-naphthoate octaprenyltransferase
MPLLRLTRPLHLLLAALTYAFGASIANYLGVPFRADAFWFGLILVFLVQMGMSLLRETFRPEYDPLLENETLRDRLKLRNTLLYISIACLAGAAAIALILFNNGQFSLSSFLFLLLAIFIVIAYSVPPLRFVNRGLGEFLLAVQLAYVFPSLAYLLQADEPHRFLALTIPLTLLAFTYFIAMNFPSFAVDRKYNRLTFLTRLGWERVVPLHHLFLSLAFLIFAASPAFGLSFSLLWPAFLTLPFALFQIFQLRNISLGLKPNWTLLAATALSVFGLTTYFLALTFWLR